MTSRPGQGAGIAASILTGITCILQGFYISFYGGLRFSFELSMILPVISIVFIVLCFVQGRRGFGVAGTAVLLILLGTDDFESMKAFALMATIICSAVMTLQVERSTGSPVATKEAEGSTVAVRAERKPLTVSIAPEKALRIACVLTLAYALCNLSQLLAVADRFYISLYYMHYNFLYMVFSMVATFSTVIAAVVIVFMKKPKVSITLTVLLLIESIYTGFVYPDPYTTYGMYSVVPAFFGSRAIGFSFTGLLSGFISALLLIAMLVFEILYILAERTRALRASGALGGPAAAQETAATSQEGGEAKPEAGCEGREAKDSDD